MNAPQSPTFPCPLIEYSTVRTIEKMGSIPLYVEALRNLDQSLDEICTKYAPTNPEQEEQLLNLCPYFGIVWPSARALGTFITERKSQFSKKNGIEVGCGLALPSLVAAKVGAQMLATDFHPDVKSWVLKNAELNQLSIQYQLWDWTTASQRDANLPAHVTAPKQQFDFVLASDVLYEKRHPEELANALARLVSPTGTIYLSDPGRVYLDRALTELKKLGFHRVDHEIEVEESSSRPEVRLEKRRKILVFEFTRT